MQLIQLFLPLADNGGRRFSRTMYDQDDQELLDAFEGFTAYPRAPANGLWRSPEETVQQDEIIVYEVMVPEIDRPWWIAYRMELEGRFQQDQLHIRAIEADVL